MCHILVLCKLALLVVVTNDQSALMKSLCNAFIMCIVYICALSLMTSNCAV